MTLNDRQIFQSPTSDSKDELKQSINLLTSTANELKQVCLTISTALMQQNKQMHVPHTHTTSNDTPESYLYDKDQVFADVSEIEKSYGEVAQQET